MLPITTLFLFVLPSWSLVDIGEVYGFGSVMSTVGVVVDPSAGIGSVLVALLVASSGGAILLGVPVERWWRTSRRDTSTRVVAKFLSKLV
jgi:hypothetical protein